MLIILILHTWKMICFIAIPDPNTTFTATGRSLGESLTLDCTVDVVDDLYNINVNISIVKNEGLITSATGSGDTTTMIMIDSIRSSDAGDYQCIVNITQPDIDYKFNGMESTEVMLTCMLFLNYCSIVIVFLHM